MLSQENENFIRFFLLVLQGGTKILRIILESCLVKEGKTIDSLLTSFLVEDKLRTSPLVNDSMLEMLYPVAPNVRDVSKWDVSLLSFIILECLKKHLNATEEMVLKQIRDYRNELSHKSEPVIDNKTYLSWWTNLVLVISTYSHGTSYEDNLYALIRSLSDVKLDVGVALGEVNSLLQTTSLDFGRIQGAIDQLTKLHAETNIKLEDIKQTQDRIADRNDEILQELRKLGKQIEDQQHTLKIVAEVKANKETTKEAAENCVFEVSKNILEQKNSEDHLLPLRANVTELFDNVEKDGNKLTGVNKGSVILEFNCSSLESMLQLIEVLLGSLIEKHLKHIKESLEDIFGENIDVDIYIPREQFKDVFGLSKSAPKRLIEYNVSCNGVKGVEHILDLFDNGAACNSLNKLGTTLSDVVGEPVRLELSVDLQDIKDFITETKVENEMTDVSVDPPKNQAQADDDDGCDNGSHFSAEQEEKEQEEMLTDDDDGSDNGSQLSVQQEEKEQEEKEHEDMLTDEDENKDLRKRVCLVKLYAWMKEQMEKSTAMYVADHLYQSGYLSQHKLEIIQECKRRREAVEKLLKHVLMGKPNIVDGFIHALHEEENGKIIAIKLTAECVTKTDIQKFEAFQKYSLGQGERPDSEGPRLRFTKNDKYVIMYNLKDETDIDFIINHLLSRFYVSIHEHNDVVRCSFSEKGRVNLLIKTMMMCPETLRTYFYELLKEMKISYVIEKLDTPKKTSPSRKGQKRKRPTTNANAQCMSDDEMKQFDLDSYTNDEIGFGMEKVSRGSILIQMYPTGPDSWHKLEDKCRSGKIKDCIQVMFNKVAKHSLQEGIYNFKITIFTLTSTKDNQDNKMCLFHLETDRKSSKVGRTIHAENQILKLTKLLCKELEVNDELLTVLQQEQLVQSNIKQDLEKLETRAAKIKYLLMTVASNGDKGYEVLKNYVMQNNDDLYRNMVASEEISVTNSILKERRVRRSRRHAYNKDNKALFFTGIAVIIVKRSVKTKNNSRQLCSLNISCPIILDPIIYVSAKD